MHSLVSDAKHRHCDHGGGCLQSIRREQEESENQPLLLSWVGSALGLLSASFGMISQTPCVDMFNITNMTDQAERFKIIYF